MWKFSVTIGCCDYELRLSHPSLFWYRKSHWQVLKDIYVFSFLPCWRYYCRINYTLVILMSFTKPISNEVDDEELLRTNEYNLLLLASHFKTQCKKEMKISTWSKDLIDMPNDIQRGRISASRPFMLLALFLVPKMR